MFTTKAARGWCSITSGTCLHAHIQPFSTRLQKSRWVFHPCWVFYPSHFIWGLKLHLRYLWAPLNSKDNVRNTRKPRLWHSERGINFHHTPLALSFEPLLHPAQGSSAPTLLWLGTLKRLFHLCVSRESIIIWCAVKPPGSLRQNNLIAGITQPCTCAGTDPKIRAALPTPPLCSSHVPTQLVTVLRRGLFRYELLCTGFTLLFLLFLTLNVCWEDEQ